MPDPYIPKEPNDLIRAADWNQIQIDARTEIQSGHDHSGGDKGVQLGTEAIADGAVTKAKLAEDVSVGVEPGSVGEQELADGSVTLAKLAAAVLTRLDAIEDIAKQALELAGQAAAAADTADDTAGSARTKANVALSLIYDELKPGLAAIQTTAGQAKVSATFAHTRINGFHGSPDFEGIPELDDSMKHNLEKLTSESVIENFNDPIINPLINPVING